MTKDITDLRLVIILKTLDSQFALTNTIIFNTLNFIINFFPTEHINPTNRELKHVDYFILWITTDRSDEMSWKPEVDEIARRRRLAEKMGGTEKVAIHHQSGKLTARERIASLIDPGSFQEIGALTGAAKYDASGNLIDFTPANVVIGQGRIDGRRVVVSAEDFTVRGGSSEATISDKWIWAETLALEMRMPLVRLVDTAGGSVKLLEKAGATKIPGYPKWNFADLLGIVPVVGVAMGSVAGLGAFRVVVSHFSVMVKGTSQVFAAGPPLVTPATAEKVTKEELGGYEIHARGSGAVDNEAEDEKDAFYLARCFLSYMPPNVYKLPPRYECNDPTDRCEEELIWVRLFCNNLKK